LYAGETGRVAVGVYVDTRSNSIFVAGGGTGKGYVYDAATGTPLNELTLTAPGSFVNDVVVTRDAAFFTDSFRSVLYRVEIGSGVSVSGTPQEIELAEIMWPWRIQRQRY